MKRIVAGASCAIALLGLAGPAVAVPIYFDFTGSITSNPDGAPTGQAMSGGFTLETDRLVESPPRPNQRQWLDLNPAGLAEPLAQIDLGDRNVTFPRFPGTTDAVISFNDGCTPAGCASFGTDNFSIFVSSADQPYPPGFTGTVQVSWMYFSSLAINRPPGAPIEFFDYFDLAQIGVDSILTLPLHELVGVYSEDTLTCDAATASCRVTEQRQYGFSIDSVSRGTGVRSVPEPGTLGLLGAGLLTAFVMRRRVPRPRHV